MSETSTKELDNMEKVTEGSNPVTKNAKPGDPIDTSGSQISKVIDVNTDSEEGAKGTALSFSAIGAALLSTCP